MSSGISQTTVKLTLWGKTVAYYLNDVLKTKGIDREVCTKLNENHQSLSRHGIHKNENMTYLFVCSFVHSLVLVLYYFFNENLKENKSKI